MKKIYSKCNSFQGSGTVCSEKSSAFCVWPVSHLLRFMLYVILLASGALGVYAGNVDTALAEADTAYAQGAYDKAISLYTGLAKEYPESASILYNLGCAYYKSGNEGEARLCLERAHRLVPGDERIRRNIEYLASRVEDANKAELKGKKGNVTPDENGFFENLRLRIADRHSSNMWAFWAAACFVALTVLIGLYALSGNVIVKKWGFFGGIVLFCATAIFMIFSIMAAHQFDRTDLGVVTSFKTLMTEDGAPGAKEVSTPLHRGTRLLILDRRLNPEGQAGWYKVKLNSENIGWIPAADLTII